MIWYDMIWYDMIWYDMIWYDNIERIFICFYNVNDKTVRNVFSLMSYINCLVNIFVYIGCIKLFIQKCICKGILSQLNILNKVCFPSPKQYYLGKEIIHDTAIYIYAVKVMTSFGYEIMLTRGCWFQTLDVNKPWRQIPADRLLFLVFTHFFSWLPQGNTNRRNFVQIKPRYWKKLWGCQWQNNGTELVPCLLCLGNFPKHVLPNPCYNANAPRQYPVPLPCTSRCINAVCFGENMFNSRRSD